MPVTMEDYFDDDDFDIADMIHYDRMCSPPPTLCPTCSSDDPRSVGDEGLPDIDAPIMCDNDFHRLAAAVQPPDPKGTK